ncbi:cyclin-A1-4-like [Gastrolobium bilobum]|uniref:cyclin-A1-4-like n=1 Tax=Gastrolobium bilobum TaxID=150636 RepID=UPI002AB18903|nr:cyclin-A1-4-like [Gastrolobium bilobum]
MFTRNRHLRSSSSSSEKRSSVSENSSKKVNTVKTHLTKKRTPLADVSNNRNASLAGAKTSISAPSNPLVPCVSKTAKTKDSIASSQKKVMTGKTLKASLSIKSSELVLSKDACSTRSSQPKAGVGAFPAPSTDVAVCPDLNIGVISPSKSFSGSVSLDESMSTSDSLKTPEFDYIDSDDLVLTKSIDNKTCSTLNVSDSSLLAGRICGSDTIKKIEANEVVDIDYNVKDPQSCALFAHEIYECLRKSEEIKRPSMDYMERIQKDLYPIMRAILIDWLVEVAEEYRLLPDTLFLTVNYIDRYLSGNAMHRQRLQLLGVACMLIAAKYEEICAPKVEEFCYITDNTYSKEQVFQMESAVLNFLKFEITAPTARCFLRRFIIVAKRTCEVPLMQLEYLADYLAELSLIEYGMLKYSPSLIAASATFLAIYILLPRKKPWNSTLRHYTGYQASELCECVKGLHLLCCDGCHDLPAIREKYSQHKFKFVAKEYCPPSIPLDIFGN